MDEPKQEMKDHKQPSRVVLCSNVSFIMEFFQIIYVNSNVTLLASFSTALLSEHFEIFCVFGEYTNFKIRDVIIYINAH